MSYRTLRVEFKDNICFIQIYRPEAKNTINDMLVHEFHHVLDLCEEAVTTVVIEGLPDFFCFGADFQGMYDKAVKKKLSENDPKPLYELWMRLAEGPYITVSHVKGKVNAGGIGFIAASDIVIAGESAQFGLSDLLFGLYPACVLPFLIRRVGYKNANYMTIMTHIIGVHQAQAWGLIDAYDAQSEVALRKHLIRLKLLSKSAIKQYKEYINSLDNLHVSAKNLAIKSNTEALLDKNTQQKIIRYVEQGLFPWEK